MLLAFRVLLLTPHDYNAYLEGRARIFNDKEKSACQTLDCVTHAVSFQCRPPVVFILTANARGISLATCAAEGPFDLVCKVTPPAEDHRVFMKEWTFRMTKLQNKLHSCAKH